VAHLSKDGLMFIHPTQNRSLTPREAARIQSFPDWFIFPKAQTHSFRLIGNAVPPLVAESVGNSISNFLTDTYKDYKTYKNKVNITQSSNDAKINLQKLMTYKSSDLGNVKLDVFLNGWHAILFLLPHLHPVSAKDHGEDKIYWPEGKNIILDYTLFDQNIYIRSGWPVSLEFIVKEAWKRYNSGKISDDSFFCTKAQAAGLHSLKSNFKITHIKSET